MNSRWLMETTIPILVLTNYGDNFTVDEVNPSFCDLLKLDINDVAGKTLDEIIDMREGLEWLQRYEKEDMALIDIDGDWFEVELVEGPNSTAYIHHNLTAQVEMDSSNKHLQTRLNQIQRIAQIGDWEHNYRTEQEFWSDEIYRMLDFKDKTIKANINTFMRFVHPDDVRRVKQAHEQVISGQGYSVEYRIITIEGKIRWIVTRAKVDLDDDGNVVRLYGTMQDITDRKKLQQKVEQAFDVVEDAYQSKNQFLAMISHEIRTPINGILGMGQLLKDTILDDEQGEFVDDILFSADALLSMIEDVLEMSKLESNLLKADIEEFDLQILVRNLIRMYQIKNSNRGVAFIHRIDKDLPKHVFGDASKIQQILINLLGNAFKFTSEGSVCMTVRKLEETAEKIKIAFEVEDTGIGISEEMQKKLFTQMIPGQDSAITNYEGSGLGLAICKSYAELMQGYMLVESEISKGSKFTFAITLEKANRSDVESGTSKLRTRINSAHTRVLVIEEKEVEKNYYQGYLEDMCGFDVDFAQDINEVLQALDQFRYAFVILSGQLRASDSIYILKTLRDSLNYTQHDLPIIVVTSSENRGNLSEFAAGGTSYFLETPIDEAQMLGMINEILDLSIFKGKSNKRFAYRYIQQGELEKSRRHVGNETFDTRMRDFVIGSPKKVNAVLAATEPLNILMLSHEIDGIDDLISKFGSEDICESMEMIKAALLNDDTAGIEVIVEDFMEEYQCFVKELQDFLNGKNAVIKKN